MNSFILNFENVSVKSRKELSKFEQFPNLPWHTGPFNRVVNTIVINLIVTFLTSFSDISLIRISTLDSFFMNFLLLPSRFFAGFQLILKVGKRFLDKLLFKGILRNRSSLNRFSLNKFNVFNLIQSIKSVFTLRTYIEARSSAFTAASYSLYATSASSSSFTNMFVLCSAPTFL